MSIIGKLLLLSAPAEYRLSMLGVLAVIIGLVILYAYISYKMRKAYADD